MTEEVQMRVRKLMFKKLWIHDLEVEHRVKCLGNILDQLTPWVCAVAQYLSALNFHFYMYSFD